jgi:cation diffusion facilitator family transporter
MTSAPAALPAMELTGRGVRRVLWITLGLNIAVSVAKIAVGKMSGSMAMVADGYHSLTDGGNNIAGLVVTGFAYAPPDEGHPYGHRKFETAATLALALALLSVAWHLISEGLGKTSAAHIPDIGPLAWAVMIGTLLVNMFVAFYEARQGRKLQSPYLLADSAHTRSDIYVTLGVIASFAGARAGVAWMDVAVSIGIALFIGFLGVQILVGSFHTLTDRAVIPAETLSPIVLAVPGVMDCREIRTRGGPGSVYVDLIVHVDGGMTLRDAHDVADWIEAALMMQRPTSWTSSSTWSRQGSARPRPRNARRADSALLPPAVVAGADAAQQAEGVDAGGVAVRPGEAERVVAHALHVAQLLAVQVEVARHRLVALAPRAGAPAAQVVEGVGGLVAVVPQEDEPARGFLVARLDGLRVGGEGGHETIIAGAGPDGNGDENGRYGRVNGTSCDRMSRPIWSRTVRRAT